ncbi:MAG: hypothetical protein MI919_05635, partial [Holophagales bacterium]|nr:hypothetical protein [Holophagales bacterium]
MPTPSPNTVLLAGFPPAAARRISELWSGVGGPLDALGPDADIELLDPALAAVAFGPELPAERVQTWIEQAAAQSARGPVGLPRFLVLAAGELDGFGSLVERDLLYFLSREPPDAAAVSALLSAALRAGRLEPTASLDGPRRSGATASPEDDPAPSFGRSEQALILSRR